MTEKLVDQCNYLKHTAVSNRQTNGGSRTCCPSIVADNLPQSILDVAWLVEIRQTSENRIAEVKCPILSYMRSETKEFLQMLDT